MQVGSGQRSFKTLVGRLVSLIVICAGTSVVWGQERNVVVGETPVQLQQLVAPIALYPDQLVAQILTASDES